MSGFKSAEKSARAAVRRYLALSSATVLGLGVVVVLHLVAVLGRGRAMDFRLPPLAQLLLLGLLVVLSNLALGVWRRSEFLPDTRKIRRWSLLLLAAAWALYCLDLYLDPVLNWLLPGV